MTQDNVQVAERRINGTLHLFAGRVSVDRTVQTQQGVKTTLKIRDVLSLAKDAAPASEAI